MSSKNKAWNLAPIFTRHRFIPHPIRVNVAHSYDMATGRAGTLKCDQHQRMTSVWSCSYVISAFCICVNCQEWGLWQQVMVFTLDVCILKNGKGNIKEKRDIICEWTFNEQHCLCS